MSEAVARRAPGRTSAAGQLSDDIGDVLASIRRMISQDSAPRPAQRLASAEAPASVLRLDAAVAAPEGEGVPDLLARARQLTRRGEDAPSSPLRLGAAERVAEAEDHPAMPQAEDAGVEPAAPQAVPMPEPLPEAAATDAEPAEPEAAMPQAEAQGAGPLQPLAEAEALILSTPPATAPARPGPDASEPFPTPAPMEPAMTTSPAEDDAGASIFSGMIRDMIRQELHGDPSGRMSRDLRAMVLREVAMAITGQKPAAG